VGCHTALCYDLELAVEVANVAWSGIILWALQLSAEFAFATMQWHAIPWKCVEHSAFFSLNNKNYCGLKPFGQATLSSFSSAQISTEASF